MDDASKSGSSAVSPGEQAPSDLPVATAAAELPAAKPVRKSEKRARVTSRTPSADVKGALTDAAEAVLMREGPGAVTVRAVATEAGVAPMGVYNRFGSKDGLIGALLIRGFQGLTAAISAHPGETGPVDRIWMSGVRYREYALSHRSHYALMLGDLGAKAQPPSQEFAECAGSSFQILVDHVATMMAAGCFGADDPVAVARQTWSAVHGAVALEMGGLIHPDEAEASYRRVLTMILRAFAEPGVLEFGAPDAPPVIVRTSP